MAIFIEEMNYVTKAMISTSRFLKNLGVDNGIS